MDGRLERFELPEEPDENADAKTWAKHAAECVRLFIANGPCHRHAFAIGELKRNQERIRLALALLAGSLLAVGIGGAILRML